MSIIKQKRIILFDGVCNFCIGWIQFIINHDYDDVFRFVSIQSVKGQEIIKKYNLDVEKNDSIFLLKNKLLIDRSTAVLDILFDLKTVWKVFLILYLVPKPIRDFFYNLVAKRRHVFLGTRSKCFIPNKNIKSKFLK